MQDVSPQSIRAFAATLRGGQAELARLMGMDAIKLNKVIKGRRKLQTPEADRLRRIMAGPTHGGMAQAARPYTGLRDTPLMQAAQLLAADIASPGFWTADYTVPGLGIHRNDLLVLDLNPSPGNDDTVIANIYDEAGEGVTEFRKIFDDLLLPVGPDQGPPVRRSSNAASIFAVVCAVLRA